MLFTGYQSQTRCRTHTVGQDFVRQVPTKFLSEEPAHSLHTWCNPFDWNTYNAVSSSVHSFKVELGVKVLYIGMMLRLSITLKIPWWHLTVMWKWRCLNPNFTTAWVILVQWRLASLSDHIPRRAVTESFSWASTAHSCALWRLELRFCEWEKVLQWQAEVHRRTKSLNFSLHSDYSCLHVRVTDIVLCPSTQLHQSFIVPQNSTQRCCSDSPPSWEKDFQSCWVHIVYMEITFRLSQKFCLFSEEFCLSFRTLLYQFSDSISYIKCVFQQWNFFFCSPDSKI